MMDAWAYIAETVRAERPRISDLTLVKWKTRGVPFWARAAVLARATREGVTLPDDAFRPRPRKARSGAESAAA